MFWKDPPCGWGEGPGAQQGVGDTVAGLGGTERGQGVQQVIWRFCEVSGVVVGDEGFGGGLGA